MASDITTGLDFAFVNETSAPSHYRIMLYGPPGTGKSVAAASAPGPVLVINADRPGAYRYARKRHGRERIREVRFEGKQTLDEVYRYLRDGGNGEQTLVLDPLGSVHRTMLERLAGGGQIKIQHYGQVQDTILRFLVSARALPIHLVVICHEQIDDSEEGGATRRPLTGGSKLPEQVMGEMDVVAFCGVIPERDGKPRRYVGQLVEDRGRRAKDSTDALGKARDLDLAEWIATADVSLAVEDEPTPFDAVKAVEKTFDAKEEKAA